MPGGERVPAHRTRARRRSVAVAVAVAASVLAACAGPARRSPTAAATTVATATSVPPATTGTSATVGTTTAATSTTTSITTTTSTATTRAASATITTTTTKPPVPTTPAGATVAALAGLTASTQALVVAAPRYGATTAVLTAYERAGPGWRVALGPWTAYVGYNGVAPPGAKREGDGRTPSGTYGFGFFFGVLPDPGVHFAYRRITGTNIVWDDDPASPRYNQWVDTTQASAGAGPEPMDVTPQYDYGAVIAYNTAATPGLGSAIFLHVAKVSTTTGCVSLPASDLLAVLRWLDPTAHPVIAIGVFP